MNGPAVSMAEAARITRLSISTIRRRRDALTTYGATRHESGWMIPISALVTLGMMPSTTPPDAPSDTQSSAGVTPIMTPADDGAMTALATERDAALERARAAEHRAEIAERMATERDRVIEAQAHALRVLEASPLDRGKPEAGQKPAESPPVAEVEQRSQSFFNRLFGRR